MITHDINNTLIVKCEKVENCFFIYELKPKITGPVAVYPVGDSTSTAVDSMSDLITYNPTELVINIYPIEKFHFNFEIFKNTAKFVFQKIAACEVIDIGMLFTAPMEKPTELIFRRVGIAITILLNATINTIQQLVYSPEVKAAEKIIALSNGSSLNFKRKKQ